jgi:hypothetical protein
MECEEDRYLNERLEKAVIWDETRKTFPFVVLLLLFRAGMPRDALEYCQFSNVVVVKDFGNNILSRFVEANGQLSREDLKHVRAYQQPSVDICCQTLLNIMTGDAKQSVFFLDLMEIIFENEINNQLWYYLKLACFTPPP